MDKKLYEKIRVKGGELLEEYFPKGECKERDKAMLFFALLLEEIKNE